MIGEELLRNKVDDLKCLVFDTETEGVNLFSTRPWQLSFSLTKGQHRVDDQDYYLWWEDLNVSPEAARITGFNYEEYKQKAVDPAKVLTEFNKYLRDPEYLIVGSNILGFDIYMYRTMCRECKVDADFSWLDRLYDTMCLGRAITLGIKPDLENMLLWQYRLANLRRRGMRSGLKAMATDYKVSFSEDRLHDAANDVAVSFEVFKKQIWLLPI